jgi:hypothetical protein
MAPARPLDVSRAAAPRSLPAHLGPLSGEPVPLSKSERLYYARYGGQADKRTYRDAEGTPLTVLRVHTGSPLRHLHGPDRCLLGAGHRVTRLGVVRGSAPSVLYRSVAPDGAAWRVEASFMSDDGRFATGVSEVVWLWLERPDVAWSLIERITPWSLCASEPALCHDFERSLFRSLEPLAEPPQLAALGGAMQSPFLTPDHQGALSCDPVCPPPTGPPIRPAAR